jgi:hypothetical protein
MKELIISVLLAIAILTFVLLVTSCGTRKIETNKRDSISINNTYQEGSKIVLGNTFTYKPFDALKPMQIEGKTYHNVIITNNKDRIVEKWKNRNITKTITVVREKKSEKSDNSIMWIGVSLVVVMGIVAYLKIPRL